MNVSSVLKSGPLRALVAAEVISTTGSQMTWVALPWFVLTTTGSATRMSFVVAAEVIGMGLLTIPGTRLLGWLGARRTMMVSDAFRAPLIAIVPIMHWTGGLSLGVLLAIAFAIGSLTAPAFSANKMILPELFGEDEGVVTEANALTQMATRTSLLIGPIVAGVLIGFIGAPAVLLVDAASYLVSFLLVALFVPNKPPVEAPEEGRSVKIAVRFLIREPLLRIWGPALAIGDAAWTAFFIAVPVLVVARFDSNPRVVGWLFASFGIGALLGNVISFRVARRIEGTQLIATFILGQALPLWLLTIQLPAGVYCAALAVSGIANGIVNPPLHATMTLRVPEALRPVVIPTMMLTWTILQPIGIFVAGPVLDAFGTEPVMVAFAVIQTLMMGLAALACIWVRPREAVTALAAGSPSQ
jgi:MFS family permease